jgi:hypothetical protein
MKEQMTEEEHYELASRLADKIFTVADEADCDPAVLMQSCIRVLGYLLRAMVPPDMRKDVHAQIIKKLWTEMSRTEPAKPVH